MTAVPAAKRALVGAVKGRLPEALVRPRLPTKVPSERERMYVAGTENRQRTQRSGAQVESFDLRLIVEVYRTGAESGGEAENRMWAIFGEIEAIVADDPELGGVVWAAEVTDSAEETFPSANGWLSRGTGRLHVEAYS